MSIDSADTSVLTMFGSPKNNFIISKMLRYAVSKKGKMFSENEPSGSFPASPVVRLHESFNKGTTDSCTIRRFPKSFKYLKLYSTKCFNKDL